MTSDLNGDFAKRLGWIKLKTLAFGGTPSRSVPSFHAQAAMAGMYMGLARKLDYTMYVDLRNTISGAAFEAF